MLKKINEGRVESDTGFSVHIIGLECLKYEDDDNSIEIEWNYDPITKKTYVYVSDLKNMNVTDENKIISNIKDALNLLDGNFELV